jgi:ATP-dependent exoDNAse (exonuclease V) beta subunit
LNAYFRRVRQDGKEEQEFSDAEGRLFRMDRIIMDNDRITVVDYKTGGEKEDEEKYRLQIKTYMKILKEVYPEMEISGIISYVDRKEVRRIS